MSAKLDWAILRHVMKLKDEECRSVLKAGLFTPTTNQCHAMLALQAWQSVNNRSANIQFCSSYRKNEATSYSVTIREGDRQMGYGCSQLLEVSITQALAQAIMRSTIHRNSDTSHPTNAVKS